MSFCLLNEELGVEYVINFFAVKTYNGSKDKNAKAEILSGNKVSEKFPVDEFAWMNTTGFTSKYYQKLWWN